MNRLLLLGNALLAVCLLALLFVNGREAQAHRRAELGTVSTLPRNSVRWSSLAVGAHLRAVVGFGTLMQSLEELDELPPPGCVRCDPEVPLRVRWHSPNELAVESLQPLSAATTYQLRLATSLRALDGRSLPADCLLEFSTPRPQLEGVSSEEDAQGTRLHLRFDQKLPLEGLRKALAVVDEKGTALSSELRGITDERARDQAFVVDLGSTAPGTVILTTTGDVVPLRGNLPLEPLRRRVRLREPLRVARVAADRGAIRLHFSRVIERPDPALVTLEPKQPFQLQADRDQMLVLGEFKPGSTVTVRLEPGFPNRSRTQLATPALHRVHVPDLEPRVEFGQQGSILSALARPELTLESVNLREYSLSVRSVFPNNVVHMLRDGGKHGIDADLCGPAQTQTFRPAAQTNEVALQSLDLATLLGDKRGWHWLELCHDQGWHCDSRLVQVTDLGLSLRVALGAVAVRVRSLAKGTAVANAYVRVLSAANQELTSGVTDGEGKVLLRFRTPAEPFAVVATNGEDAACISLEDHRVDLNGDALGGRNQLGGNLEAYVALDRSAIRPGETVRATVLVRDQQGRAPAGTRVEARFFAPDRRRLASQRLLEEGHGLLTASLDLPLTAATGGYRLAILSADGRQELGGAAFRVDAFVPDRLEVEVASLEPLVAGGIGILGLRGRWLEGTPAAGLEAKVALRVAAQAPPPPGCEGYAFTPLELPPPPGAQEPATVVLDGEGRAQARFALPTAAPLQLLQAHVLATVTDPSGRLVRAESFLPVTPPSGLVGVRAVPGGAEAVVVDADGQPVRAPRQVVLRLERREWTWDAAPRDGRRWHAVARIQGVLLAEQQLTTADGKVRARFDVPADGGWLVVSARLDGQVAEQNVGHAPLRPDTLRVSLPGGRVRPGTSARVQVDAPSAASAFVTLESETIEAASVHALIAGKNEILVPIPASMPHSCVHVVVTATAAQARKDLKAPVWLCGAAPLLLAHDERTTAVRIEAPAKVLPEAEVEFRIHAPGATRATLALVDEGILRLTQHPSPDPVAWFLGPRRLAGRGADSGTDLLSGVTFDPGVLIGGGDDGMGGRRSGSIVRTIETVVLSAGPLALDAEGWATCKLRLPPYEGRLRAMVVAGGPEVVGGGAAPLVVAAPLGVMLALPRRMSPGDTSEVVVTVRNSTGASGKVRLAFEAEPGLVLAEGTREVDLADGKITSFAIPFTAGSTLGTPAITARAGLGSAVRTARVRTTVQPLDLYTEIALGVAVQGEQRLTVPKEFRAEQLQVRLQLDGEPEARLLPVLEALLAYPYGCLEQTTSRCHALLACRTLLARRHGEGTAHDPTFLLQAGIDRILSMQTSRGGLAWWPGQHDEYEFGSVYALEFLLAARAQGLDVPAEPLAELVRAVERILASAQHQSLSAAAAQALAGADRPLQSWLTRLSEEADTREARLRLALAWARLGQREAAQTQLEAALALPEAQARDGLLLGSALRNDALELRARLLATPAHERVLALAARLTRAALAPAELSTQEQAQVLLAIADHVRLRGGHGGPVRASVRVGDREHRIDRSQTLTLAAPPGAEIVITSTGELFGALLVAGFQPVVAHKQHALASLRREIVRPAPDQPVRRGDVLTIVLRGTLAERLESVLVTDRLPAGLEFEPEAPELLRNHEWVTDRSARVERRDDRLFWFAPPTLHGEFALRYRVRAVFAGVQAQGVATLEALYEPGFFCSSAPEPPLSIQARP